MLLRKDNRALVVDIKPGVVEARLREMHCQKVFMTNPDMLQRFVLLGHCLLVCDMPRGAGPIPESRWGSQHAPVLFLADRSSVPHGIPGRAGENYLVKPFAFSDFLERVHGLLRWRTDRAQMTLQIGGLELDLMRHRASRDGRRLDLTPKEFLLLSLLMRKSGEVLSRAYISDQVWEINFESNTNFVDVHIRRLRSKVDDPFPTKLIHTVRGMGYVLEER